MASIASLAVLAPQELRASLSAPRASHPCQLRRCDARARDGFSPGCASAGPALFVLAVARQVGRAGRRLSRRAAVPSPPGALPVVGHLPLIGIGALGVPGIPPPHVVMNRLAQRYGDVMGLRFGASDVVLLSSPDAIEQVLTAEEGHAAAGRPSLPSVQANGLSSGLSSARPDQEWATIRSALLGEAFAATSVDRAAPVIRAEAEHLVDRIRPLAGTSVELRPLLRHSVTQLLLSWALSLDRGQPEAIELEDLIERAWTILTDPLTTVADFTRAPSVASSLPQIRRQRTSLLSKLIAARRRGKQPKRKRDFLDALLAAQRRKGFSDLLVIETIGSLTTAGISTVANTLEWLLLLLAQNPVAQREARRDVECHQRDGYLDACIQETLRLKTPLFVPRRCEEEVHLQGYRIPAGTLVLPDSYAVAHDPDLWKGGSVHDFCPERFLGAERPLLYHRPSARPRCPFSGTGRGSTAYKHLPFGAGARFCPGAPLALAEINAFAAAFLRAFEWELDGVASLEEAYSFTLTPKTPARLRFRLR